MIWIVGKNGMLGREVVEQLEAEELEYCASDIEVDITDRRAIQEFVRDKSIDWIVNCAAYTAVDRAEEEREAAERLNIEGPANLAAAASSIGARIIHISTDYVFDGAGIPDKTGKLRPYREDDPTVPTGVYGRTKAEGESAVLSTCSRSVILRTSWLYGRHGPNFVFTMLRLMAERDTISVVADQKGSPTWAWDLARAIIAIVGAAKPAYGIYHYSNAGICSWYDFARAIYRIGREEGLLETECTIAPVTTEQYPTKAKRPAWSVLDKGKIIGEYGVAVPQWEESLGRFLKRAGLNQLNF
jgi:dTDP-4-dehydrorhamnose reductase